MTDRRPPSASEKAADGAQDPALRGDLKQVTFHLDAELHRRLKVAAASEDRTMSEIVSEALDDYLGGPGVVRTVGDGQ